MMSAKLSGSISLNNSRSFPPSNDIWVRSPCKRSTKPPKSLFVYVPLASGSSTIIWYLETTREILYILWPNNITIMLSLLDNALTEQFFKDNCYMILKNIQYNIYFVYTETRYPRTLKLMCMAYLCHNPYILHSYQESPILTALQTITVYSNLGNFPGGNHFWSFIRIIRVVFLSIVLKYSSSSISVPSCSKTTFTGTSVGRPILSRAKTRTKKIQINCKCTLWKNITAKNWIYYQHKLHHTANNKIL